MSQRSVPPAARGRRARPLAPDDRRAAIVAATIPLLRARGWSVTTKEIAAAARVADGTIFSVFKDKEELILTALQAALDPQPTMDKLSQIDLLLPLEERLAEAVDILKALVTRQTELLSTMNLGEVRGKLSRRYSVDYLAQDALPRLFEPSRDELRLEPATAGQALLALILSGCSPLHFKKPLQASEVVALMLDGVRIPRPPEPPAHVRDENRGTA